MADAQEYEQSEQMQSLLQNLNPQVYQPQLDAPQIIDTAIVFHKAPDYAIVFIPNIQEYAILNPEHLNMQNRASFDRLEQQVMLVNAIFYPVLNYDFILHNAELVCCGWRSTESSEKSLAYLSRTNPEKVMRIFESSAKAHRDQCNECSGPDQLCATGRNWKFILEQTMPSPERNEEEQELPEAVLRRRNQPESEEIHAPEPPKQEASPTKAEQQSTDPQTGQNELRLVLVWLARLAGVLTFAQGLTIFFLALLEALDVKLGVLGYFELFEATMAVEFLFELRNGMSTPVYPTVLALDILARVLILIGNYFKGTPIGIGDIVASALFVGGYSVLIAVLGLRHYVMSLASRRNDARPSDVRKRRAASNTNNNDDGSQQPLTGA